MGRMIVHIYGKPKDNNLASMISEYSNRLVSRGITLKIHSDKKDSHYYENNLATLKGNLIILDENGIQKTSKQFSDFISNISLSNETVNFATGPPDGFSDLLKNKAIKIISLSKMTFIHEMASCILLEQLYRATEIIKGSSYHRE
ncbi:MAG: 50S rRNA methyltransferase [Marine Group II euryarchaeote MED-G38]|nr:MAG: 50S rRNA methyltransferase [Marine Group II euryarchaeote MED-G38]|tara:strand:+ start:73883 stop:74317 length:435 start_codon:yes stop_codon:yes gene_type:complete